MTTLHDRQWPQRGVPEHPAAWLTATAKNRAIDWIRHRSMHARKQDSLTHEIENQLEDARTNLDQLLEMLLLVADLADLKADGLF